MVNCPQSQTAVTLTTDVGRINGAMGCMGLRHIGIGGATGRIGVAGDAVVRICLGIEQMTGQTAGNYLTRCCSNVSCNLMATKAIREIAAGGCVVVVVGDAMGGDTGAAGMAGPGLAEAIGEGCAETAWGRR